MDSVRKEDMLRRVGEEREILKLTRRRKRNYLGYGMRRENMFLGDIESTVNGRKRRGQKEDNG